MHDDQPTSSVTPAHTQEDNVQPQSTIKDTKTIRNARKHRSDQIDELLAVSLAQELKSSKGTQEIPGDKSKDQDELFCSSLVSSFQKLKGKENKLAKMKVMEVLLGFENDGDDDD